MICTTTFRLDEARKRDAVISHDGSQTNCASPASALRRPAWRAQQHHGGKTRPPKPRALAGISMIAMLAAATSGTRADDCRSRRSPIRASGPLPVTTTQTRASAHEADQYRERGQADTRLFVLAGVVAFERIVTDRRRQHALRFKLVGSEIRLRARCGHGAPNRP